MLDQYVDQALRRRTAAGRADWVQPGVYYRHRDSQQVCWISKPLSICTFLHAPRNYFLQQGDPELLSISHFVSNTRASDLRIVLILNHTWTAMNQRLERNWGPIYSYIPREVHEVLMFVPCLSGTKFKIFSCLGSSCEFSLCPTSNSGLIAHEPPLIYITIYTLTTYPSTVLFLCIKDILS
jgi:hypothetical protein